jgi:hypothetical protein
MFSEDLNNAPGSPTSQFESIVETAKPLLLSGQQLSLFHALDNKDALLARMYLGALSVLEHGSNPECFAHSAHSMRELMEKLPKFINVPLHKSNDKLGVKVRDLEDGYNVLLKNTSCVDVENKWSGQIDPHLNNFLKKLKVFFEWLKISMPRRTAEIRKLLECLDGSGRQLPAPLEKMNIDEWKCINEYFQKIAHHGEVAVESEFIDKVNTLERFLVDRLVPKTFSDFEKIDALLEEEQFND